MWRSCVQTTLKPESQGQLTCSVQAHSELPHFPSSKMNRDGQHKTDFFVQQFKYGQLHRIELSDTATLKNMTRAPSYNINCYGMLIISMCIIFVKILEEGPHFFPMSLSGGLPHFFPMSLSGGLLKSGVWGTPQNEVQIQKERAQTLRKHTK